MTGNLTYALADQHINDLRAGAEKARQAPKRQRRVARRPVLGRVRRLRRAFG